MSSSSQGSRPGQFEQHKENLKNKGNQIGQDVRELGKEAQRTAGDQMECLSETANEYIERGREEAMQLAGSLEHKIREQPVQSVLVAAGIGFLFGALWLRH